MKLLKVIITAILLMQAPLLVCSAAEQVKVSLYNFKPLIFQDPKGKPLGIYADILLDFEKKFDWDLQFVECTWDQCLDKLAEGKIDITLQRHLVYKINDFNKLQEGHF